MNKAYRWPEGDKLNRKRDADILLRFIKGKLRQRENAGLQKSYVVNLDSEWGSGKTFFLNELKNYMKSLGHVAVYIDAWKDDHSNDPFAAVATKINGELKSILEEKQSSAAVAKVVEPLARSTMKVVGAGFKSAAHHFVEKKIGKEALDLLSSLGQGEVSSYGGLEESVGEFVEGAIEAAGKAALSSFEEAKLARSDFRRNLSDLSGEVIGLEGVQDPIFVLIDELDRCRPDYAVELLESVKHLFYVENVVFILATNTEQLAYAISGVYGQGFDGRRYLSRFIDRTYRFQDVKIDDFVLYSLERYGLSESSFSLPDELSAQNFLSRSFEYFGVSLRYIEQVMDYIATFVATWEVEEVKINLLLLLDLAINAHPESVTGPKKLNDRELPLFDFRRFKREAVAKGYTFNEMVKVFCQVNLKGGVVGDPGDTFVEWARRLTLQEVRYLAGGKTTGRMGHGLALEYRQMFETMQSFENISGKV
ncbi:KAP family P-loop NTPase fold protein [Sagittula sp. SSi028]|uniref:KAP family P-loop NTPase fold protein n=1 Tax=Sagittula sp. SSi028 TaxID=3400636 RepID=UPI003AF6388E